MLCIRRMIEREVKYMYNYKLTIGYDGARYSGWQKNRNAKDTIQTKLETVLFDVIGEKVQLIGSGRTDKGVHAEHQVANFHCKSRQKAGSLKYQLNSLLPDDIVVQAVNKVEDDFHARFSAESKTYRYTLWKANCETLPVFERKYVYHLEEKVDVDLMLIASQKFIGKHDFKGFSSDKTKKSTEREIFRIDVIEEEDFIEIEIEGDGFLYNMIRIIVGTLLEIGMGRCHDDTIDQVFESGDRNLAGYTVPAKGLCLVDVEYPE